MGKKLEVPFFPSFASAIRALYRAGQGDENLDPLVRVDPFGRPVGRLSDGDVVIFYNIRGEREVELTQSLSEPEFAHFSRFKFPRLHLVTMIEYAAGLKAKAAFPAEERLKNTLVEVATRAGIKVAKIAESEKAPHIGFFLNGKSEVVFPGEERVIIPSATLVSYDQEPGMKASQIVAALKQKVVEGRHRLLIVNLANVDVIGHVENKRAVIEAIETVDKCLGEIISICQQHSLCLVVTADHGSAEEWLYPEGAINTGHTKNPVPFVLADFGSAVFEKSCLRPGGELADVAPTVLQLLGLKPPEEMTGRSLLMSEADTQVSGLILRTRHGAKENNVILRSPQEHRVLLLILDGWGWREESFGNLMAAARTPNFDYLWGKFSHSLLQASGEAVGLPAGTVGNSEAGHLHLGAGRRVFLDRVRIDRAIADGRFFQNEVLREAMLLAKSTAKPLHLMGIVSHYSSHGTIRHLFALLEMAKRLEIPQVFLHAFIGRRGERPESAVYYVARVEEKAAAENCGQLATVMGRFWAMDREENWGRIEKAYRALVEGVGHRVCPERKELP